MVYVFLWNYCVRFENKIYYDLRYICRDVVLWENLGLGIVEFKFCILKNFVVYGV